MATYLTKSTNRAMERDILAAFAREGLTSHSWSNAPHDRYAAHDHPYHKVLYCLRGSITFHIEDTATSFELHPGDRLDIEPQTTHSAIVGPSGVECIEAAR